MDFKVYRVDEDVIFTNREHHLHSYLKTSDFRYADHNIRFVINNDIEIEDGIITGTLSQEYFPNAYHVNEDKSLHIIDEIEPYERTFFALDFYTQSFLVQNRKYSPINLTSSRTFERLKGIFQDGFREIFQSSFTPFPVLIPVDNTLFSQIFRSHRVKELIVSNINKGRLIVDHVQLSESVEDDERIKTLWNSDDSQTDTVHLKTTAEGDLNYSLFAIAALNAPNGLIQQIKYFDPVEDKLITVKRSKFNKFSVPNIDLNTESITAFSEIYTAIKENRPNLRNMIRFTDSD